MSFGFSVSCVFIPCETPLTRKLGIASSQHAQQSQENDLGPRMSRALIRTRHLYIASTAVGLLAHRHARFLQWSDLQGGRWELGAIAFDTPKGAELPFARSNQRASSIVHFLRTPLA